MPEQDTPVARLLDELETAARDKEDAASRKVRIGDLLDAVRQCSFGPVLFTLALIELTPLGGIPGVPTAIAVAVGLVAAQLALGQEHLWVPGALEDRTIRADHVKLAAEKVRPIGRWLDRYTRDRFEALTRPPAARMAGAVVVLLCLAVPPLELIPFASSIPMGAIALFGIALMVRDGLLMAIGFAGAVAAALGVALIVVG